MPNPAVCIGAMGADRDWCRTAGVKPRVVKRDGVLGEPS